MNEWTGAREVKVTITLPREYQLFIMRTCVCAMERERTRERKEKRREEKRRKRKQVYLFVIQIGYKKKERNDLQTPSPTTHRYLA
jgi:hypothetical protein